MGCGGINTGHSGATRNFPDNSPAEDSPEEEPWCRALRSSGCDPMAQVDGRVWFVLGVSLGDQICLEAVSFPAGKGGAHAAEVPNILEWCGNTPEH
jgi:hypothetical protein